MWLLAATVLSVSEFDLRSLLAAVEDASPIDAVDVLATELAGAVHARHVALLIANFSGSALVRLSHVDATGAGQDGRNERGEAVPLPGTVHEQVLFSQTPQIVEQPRDWLILIPVTERGDVIPFSISAEIQRRLLPSAHTLEAGPFTLAGWLEPSHDAGGDTFDYSLGREQLDLSVTDAMGHSINAAMLATLAVGTLRNRLRALASPAELADAASEALDRYARTDQFVTGLVMRLRLARRIEKSLSVRHRDSRARRPIVGDHRRLPGPAGPAARHRGHSLRHPRPAPPSDRPRAGPPDLDVTGGDLRDDATALCVDWYGPGGSRRATGGASRTRATG